MNKMELGVALIRRIEQRVQWLGKYNETRRQVDFVTALRLEKESWRETIMREVAWQLEVDRRRDFVVSSMAQMNINFETRFLHQAESTQVAAAFYNVELYRKAAMDRIAANEDFIWLTSNEICDGVTEDGLRIDPLLVLLNKEAQVIQYWESDVAGDR